MINRYRIAIGRKPNYTNNDKNEIVRIIEGKEKNMTVGQPSMGDYPINTKDPNPPDTTGDPIGMIEPTKSSRIVSILKFIGKMYIWMCTGATTIYIILTILYFFGIGIL